MKNSKTQSMMLISIFSSIIIILAFVPELGYVRIGPIALTTIHIPVIIGSILLGPKRGSALGFVFGFTSLVIATVSPDATSFAFSPFYSGSFLSLIICFVPRILIGIVPYYVYKLFKNKSTTISLGLAGFSGSMVNTVLVLNFMYFFFKEEMVKALGTETVYKAILGIITFNGILEAILATVITILVGRALLNNKAIKSQLRI